MEILNLPAEIIGGNDDLLTQILFRLPAKPLVRFKSVSKHWLSLISSSQFSSLHTRRNSNSTVSGFILRHSPSKITFLPLPPPPSPSPSPPSPLDSVITETMKILQSCNGLLLCSSFPKVGFPRSYYISNPTTNKFLTLPPLSSPSTAIHGLNLASDSSKSCDYKVICVRSSSTASVYHYQIEIYESEIGAWRLSGSPFEAPFDMVFDNGVFWNGRVYWISPTGKTLCFDVCRECIGRFPAPPFTDGWGKRRFRYFGESGGHLHLIEIYNPRSKQFEVFEMNKDCSNWIVRYHVELDLLVKEFPDMDVRTCLDGSDSTSSWYAFKILSVVEEEREEASLILHIPGKIVSYNFKTKLFKIIGDLRSRTSSNSLQYGWLDAYQYIETLACV